MAFVLSPVLLRVYPLSNKVSEVDNQALSAEAKESIPLRVLLVEDSEPDAELLLAELTKAGYRVVARRVQTADEMREALAGDVWQIVLSDYSLPGFTAPAALAITHELKPDLPFIIVSGTVGEEAAVAALKAGASDFVVKGRLARLVPAIERELRDVDLRRQRQGERDALAEQLRQSQKLEGIGRLAGGIAHDFNNLLTAVIGYTEMVLEQIGPDKPISQDLMEIRKASDRAVALTRQLLAFSRKQTLHVEAMEPNVIITDMGNMLQRLIGVDIDIRFELAPGLPPILADRVQMEQVVMNLVMNARDAMPTGGVITIETTAVQADDVMSVIHEPVTPGAYVGLRFADTGLGMTEDTLGKIFEPFFTTKAPGLGTGLGLATVYGVVQQLGGHVAVRSAVGQGTSFLLYFPAATEPVRPTSPSTRSTAAPLAMHREVVLLVEDEAGVRHLVTRILTRRGYTVLEAADGQEALAFAGNPAQVIDLVLTDVVMPTMAGPDLVTHLHALRPSLKVIYMSGYTERDLSRRVDLDAGPRLIEKPFMASALLQVVREVLDETPASAVH